MVGGLIMMYDTMTLDELYGCTLGEYLEYIGKSRESLIHELEKEIELLNNSRMNYALNKDKYSLDELVKSTQITKLMDKKREHLKRVQSWK
jgi:hypothetical protein